MIETAYSGFFRLPTPVARVLSVFAEDHGLARG